ncbi:hypothetical protein [Micromonospora radicis]|uniref:O-antigen ligase domain-containing protein n=1 Tax=Micromonospora radicis TaxID=1894971 RepID=A0A418MTZ3_9ACTN|nr:hypothetical protein [Micromonospora radicis]RIV37836.1 hypothetical protein D2L64_14830 [Micromonospora radicis]
MPLNTHQPAAGRRIAEIAVFLLVLATFGPYVVAGVRTEQLAVLLVAALAVLFRAHQLAHAPPLVTLLAALSGAYVGLAGLAALGEPLAGVGYQAVGSWAGLDNLLLPLVVLVAGYLLAVEATDRTRLVRVAATTLVVLLCLNTVIAYLTLVGSNTLNELLPHFWTNDGGLSTAESAATMGRYSGIFNQPAEGGVMYSLGLLAAVYLLWRRPLLLAATGLTLTVGGLLTASKIFLLIGLPVALWQTWRGASWRSRTGSVLALAGVLVVFDYQARQQRSQIGGVLLDGWLNPQDRSGTILSYYTASRLGEQSTLAEAADLVLTHSPWLGFGIGGIRVPYDSSWLEALVMAGVFGIALQAAIMAVLVVCWLRTRSWAEPTAVRLGAGVLIVLIGGSLGLPTLTGNRVTTVAWLLIVLLLVLPPAAHGERDPVPTASPTPHLARVPS